MEKGKFIVVYGVNNIGKSFRVEDLGAEYKNRGLRVHLLKYPIYDIPPTGPLLWQVLQEGKKMGNFHLQLTTAQNRRDFEPRLDKLVDENNLVIAEDYKGTGIAWGVTSGLPLWLMEFINLRQRREDLAILLDGERLVAGGQNHRHERRADMWAKARRVHLDLAKRYGWEIVGNAEKMKGINPELIKVVDTYLGV